MNAPAGLCRTKSAVCMYSINQRSFKLRVFEVNRPCSITRGSAVQPSRGAKEKATASQKVKAGCASCAASLSDIPYHNCSIPIFATSRPPFLSQFRRILNRTCFLLQATVLFRRILRPRSLDAHEPFLPPPFQQRRTRLSLWRR